MKTAEQALDRIENKTSSATNYTRAEMIFFANYFADIHHKQQLLLHNVVQAKPEKVCELVRQKFDDWVFGLETQAGEKLKVVDSTDFNDIITEIEKELKDL